jgi:hypothetical protein
MQSGLIFDFGCNSQNQGERHLSFLIINLQLQSILCKVKVTTHKCIIQIGLYHEEHPYWSFNMCAVTNHGFQGQGSLIMC